MFLAPPADIQESGGAFLFHKTLFPMKQKKPAPELRSRTGCYIPAVPPCLPEIRPLCTAPTRRLPVNAGNASEDTLVTHFPLPSAAHLLPRFSLCSQLCRTLCGCALQLYFRFVGFDLCYALYTSFVYVCQELFFAWRGLFPQYSRTTALTMPMISALVPSMGL